MPFGDNGSSDFGGVGAGKSTRKGASESRIYAPQQPSIKEQAVRTLENSGPLWPSEFRRKVIEAKRSEILAHVNERRKEKSTLSPRP